MSKVVDSIIGHAIGDAMGMSTEFLPREYLKNHPVTQMESSWKFRQPAGSWTDDTSMELATIDSYIKNGYFNYYDIMYSFEEWLKKDYYTPNKKCFDVGNTCFSAISSFSYGIDPIKCGLNGEYSNGNGSLMRMLPVALYCYYKKIDDKSIIKLSSEMSSLTHAHEISKLGCYIYIRYIMYLLDNYDKYEAYNLIKKLDYCSYNECSLSKYDRIINKNINEYDIDDIESTGYVVDTLECALWIFLNNNSFKDCIITSTNIGNDTDTIGAIVGSMAGIIYGIKSIPKEWLDKLKRKEYLVQMSNDFEKSLVKKL